MKVLTSRQYELLTHIARCAENGSAPVVAELASVMGLAGHSSVTPMLDALERKGYIVVRGGVRGRQRQITLTTQGKIATGQQGLPLLGCITAGPLAEVLQGAEAFIRGLEDVLPYKPGDFLLTVQGDSMIGDGIYNSDRVLLRPNIQIHNGEIAAVHVGEEYCATLKHVHFEQNGKVVKLRASNRAYPDIRVPASDVRIVGVYRGLIRAGK